MGSDLLQRLLENLPDLIVRIRLKPEVGFDYVSPGVYKLLGYTPEEFYARPELVFETVHHDDRPLVGNALAAPGREAFTARMIHKDGRTIWLECRSVGVWDESGELVAVDGIGRDVTDRILAEREAAETEARLRLALDHARILVWDHDLYTDELKLRAGEQGWAFGPDEPSTLSQLVERVHPEDRQTLAASLEKLVSRGEVDLEMRLLHPDGGEIWAENRIRLIARGDGGLGATGMTLDITARKRAEEELRAAHAGLAAIVSASPIAITATDLSLRATLWSPAAERLYGWASDEVIGRPLPTVPPEQLEETLGLLERVFAGSAVPEFETQRLRKDGTRVDVAIGLAPLLDARGDVTGVLGTGVEITQQATHRLLEQSFAALQRVDTERRRLLERLVHAQEEERARIGADIHDDSVQVLTALALRLDLLCDQLDDPQLLAWAVDLARVAHSSIAGLRGLLFELRPPALDREGLVAALRLHLEQIRIDHGLESTVESALRAEPDPVSRAILYRIAQEALTNVVKHARANRIDVVLEQTDDGVLVRISDNGLGLPSNGDSSGSGHIGLVAMRERAEMAGGWWRISSTREKGTSVEFLVPGVLGSAAEEAA